MRIPRKLKIQGRVIDVIFEPDSKMGGYLGENYNRYSQIRINSSLKRDNQERSFLEEIIHALLDESGNYKKGDDEPLVHALSSMLYVTLKENKLWFGYEENRKKRSRLDKSQGKAHP